MSVTTAEDGSVRVKFKHEGMAERQASESETQQQQPTTPGGTLTYLENQGQSSVRRKHEKIGHRRVDSETGEVTYKKVPTSQVSGAIQLGIANSIGSLASQPDRDLLVQDFEVVIKKHFPCDGTTSTPSHPFGDFRFKCYAPIAFRYFRDLFSIKPEDFLASVCSTALRELSNPGASGSVFYLTMDDKFILKTVQLKEADFLQKLLPGYYMRCTAELTAVSSSMAVGLTSPASQQNLNQNPKTLLPKFFGLFCYQTIGRNIRLCVMNNLLPSSIRMHQKYDLKGSTYKRKASKSERAKNSPTLKDLDWIEDHPDGIYLESATYDALLKTISKDCLVLESFKIMDYSLLLGIHNIDQAARDRQQALDSQDGQVPSTSARSQQDTPQQAGPPGNPQRAKPQRQQTIMSTLDAIQAKAMPIDLGEDYPPGGVPARNAKGERLLLFLGIIDILQMYRFLKKFEHAWKSVLHDGDTISVHRPSFYSQRFQDFMKSKVFKKIPSPLKHSPSKKAARPRKSTTSVDHADDDAPKATPSAAAGSSSSRPPVQRTFSSGPDRPTSLEDGGGGTPAGPPQQPPGATGAAAPSAVRQTSKRLERLFASTPPPSTPSPPYNSGGNEQQQQQQEDELPSNPQLTISPHNVMLEDTGSSGHRQQSVDQQDVVVDDVYLRYRKVTSV